MAKGLAILGALAGAVVLAIAGGYWWSNVPPKRPGDVSSNAVFLWAGHLGLPAPKHGTWIECWVDRANSANLCKLTEMNGALGYQGVFLSDTGKTPIPQSDLKILTEPTGQRRDLWVGVDGTFAPIVFLADGTVLIPKDAYQQGIANLEHFRRRRRD